MDMRRAPAGVCAILGLPGPNICACCCRGVLLFTGVLFNVDRAAISALLRNPSKVPAFAFKEGLAEPPPPPLALLTVARGLVARGGGSTPETSTGFAPAPALTTAFTLSTRPSSELESSVRRTGGA